MDALNVNDDQDGIALANAINRAADSVKSFKVQKAEINEIRAGFEAKGDAWVDIIDGKMICVPNDADS
jgi:hypothetical protein